MGETDAKYILSLNESSTVGIAAGYALITGKPSKGQLPTTTGDIYNLLLNHDTILLLGDKIDTFTWHDRESVPPQLKIIQISPAAEQLGFDWPVDMAVVGDLGATLDALARVLKVDVNQTPATDVAPDIAALDAQYPDSGPTASNAQILQILKRLDRETHICTDGSSEDDIVEDMAGKLGFRNCHWPARGGGLGWAMPLATGLAFGTGKHAVCFVGDGGSLFSIHTLWTAAAQKIPVIHFYFVNDEYRALKDLWVGFLGGDVETTKFVGMDFNDPPIDVAGIASGFGAKTLHIGSLADVDTVLDEALAHQGPTFVTIKRER